MKRAKPYVGITGFKTEAEVRQVGAIFKENGFDENFSHVPMFGYLVSEKRMSMMGTPGKQSPAAIELPYLVKQTPEGALPMLHYYTENGDTLADQVQKLFTSPGFMYEFNECRALQLNLPWPELKQMEKINSEFPEMQIVMQLPKEVMDGKSAAHIASQARRYDGLVSYVLIDPSAGFGVDFDVESSKELMTALFQTMPNTQIGVAGGFSGDNVEARIRAIQDAYVDDFCIDAQGKLRTSDKKSLDLEKVRSYVEGSAKALKDWHLQDQP